MHRNIMHKWQWSFFLLLAVTFAACDNNRFFEQSDAIANDTWYYNDAKQFEVEITDTIQPYNFYLNVRNTVDYPFANLYFFIQSEFPDGQIARDTIECQLADYQGKWLGDGRGKFRDNQFILRQNIRFQQAGIYHFELKHGMRSDSLNGIADVGIRIETVN